MDAVQREKNIKHWPPAWKVNLIEAVNPDWADHYLQLAGKGCPGRARA